MEKRIIEVNGVKMEVDFRSADVTSVESYKIGDQVRVLRQENRYGSGASFATYAGVIVGFDAFKSLPTIVIAYLDGSYSMDIKYAYINAETTDTEIIKSSADLLPIDKQRVIDSMDRDISKKEQELLEAQQKREYFLRYFNQYFGECE